MTAGKPRTGVRVLDRTDLWGELSGRLFAESEPRSSGRPWRKPVASGDDPGGLPACPDFSISTATGVSDHWDGSSRRPSPRRGTSGLGRRVAYSARGGAPLAECLEPTDVLGRHPHLAITLSPLSVEPVRTPNGKQPDPRSTP